MPRLQKPVCTYGDCESKSAARDLCQMHYVRWKKHGDASKGARRAWTPREDRAIITRMGQNPVPRHTWTGLAKRLDRTHLAVTTRVHILRYGRVGR